LPFLAESTDDAEESVLLELAVQLGRMTPWIGGARHAHCLLEPLGALALVDDSTAIPAEAVRSLVALAETLSPSQVRAHLLPLLFRLGRHEWFAPRMAACGLLAKSLSLVLFPEAAATAKAGATSAAVADAVAVRRVEERLGAVAEQAATLQRLATAAAAGGSSGGDDRVDEDAVLAAAAAAMPGVAGGAGAEQKESEDEDDAMDTGAAATALSAADVEALLALAPRVWSLYRRLTTDQIPNVRRAACNALADISTAVAQGYVPVPRRAATASVASAASASASSAALASGGAGAAASGALLSATGAVDGVKPDAAAAAAPDGYNVDTGDITASSVPPPVPVPIAVSAASPALGRASADLLVPFLRHFAGDAQDSVRLLSVDACVALSHIRSAATAAGSAAAAAATGSTTEAAVALGLSRDSSWRVRWSLANRLSEVAAALPAPVVRRDLGPVLDALLRDAEAEVKTAASYRIGEMAKYLLASAGAAAAASASDREAEERLLQCVNTLTEDPSEHVRAAVASVVLALAPLLGHDSTVSVLLPIFLRLLRDASSQVRLNVLTKVETLNRVVGLTTLSQALLPSISELAQDRQWRVRRAVIDFIPLLARQLGSAFFNSHLVDLCLSFLTDPVAVIRDAGAFNLRRLTESFGADWAAKSIIPKILAFGDGTYLRRFTRLHAAVTVADSECAGSNTLVSLLLPAILAYTTDPVPNVRFNVAKALARLSRRIQMASEAAVHTAGAKLSDTGLANAAQSALSTLAEDADDDVRFYAAKAMSTF
jgi:serine/threonine-protein phosphatase 2A regulatory subunit A